MTTKRTDSRIYVSSDEAATAIRGLRLAEVPPIKAMLAIPYSIGTVRLLYSIRLIKISARLELRN